MTWVVIDSVVSGSSTGALIDLSSRVTEPILLAFAALTGRCRFRQVRAVIDGFDVARALDGGGPRPRAGLGVRP
ncbi:hypothetical protein [Streptomyces sp. MI02-7b]|uniref:hypothetical protein n=1 Tax=Streptomyces sp. MI02-7b TaxID=462941 RepID=UPI0029B8E227|nr:hypothetical protein [Streptomyces sp. MI02-7b]MDX3075519.1 hypothetical protein [Streptomyces sp. MI02-7b]